MNNVPGVFECNAHTSLSRRWNVTFDLLAAFPYVVHFVLPVLFIAYNMIVRRSRGLSVIYQYLWCVGWTNIVAGTVVFILVMSLVELVIEVNVYIFRIMLLLY